MENKPIYRSAEELGIEEVTRQGLIQLARDLADGTMPAERFHMDYWQPSASPCGTACCIGGHFHLRKLSFSTAEAWRMKSLFYPHSMAALSCTDPLKGSRAITNFLVTGDPQWGRVMSEPSA